MKKRKIMSISIAICLIAILACGTLAYFTDTESVTNKFYTATYDPTDPTPPTPDELFSITVTETGAATYTDASGNELYGKQYEDILPGDELSKDPTITNTGKYDAYVRLSVKVTDVAAWEAAGITDLTTLFVNVNSDWECKETNKDTVNDTVTYVYYLKEKLEPEGTSTLFEGVKIPNELDVNDMVALETFDIIITGDAIQARNTGSSAYEAFTTYWGK